MSASPEAPASVSPASVTVEQPEALYSKLRPGPGRPASKVSAHQRARIHSAMVELVVEQGYDDVTVRGLARLAKVSSRAFYKHFEGKEDCFLRTYELIVQRTAKRIVASQVGECDWQKRLRLALKAFARELDREPLAARLALIEAYAAGPAALERIRRAECTFEAMIGESFASALEGAVIPPFIPEGIAAGIARSARARITTENSETSHDFGDALFHWALCYIDAAVTELVELDRQAAVRAPAGSLSLARAKSNDGQVRADDRTLIFAAIAKLAVAQDYDGLTVSRILSATGVPRRSFMAHFAGVEDCLLGAIELRAGEAITSAARAQATAQSWESGIYRAIASLCTQVAQDPSLARLCFVDIFALGVSGMECRERLIAEIVALTRDTAPTSQRPDRLAAEASVAAVWDAIQQHVVSGRAQQLPRLVASLSFFVMAPVVGAREATNAIRQETR